MPRRANRVRTQRQGIELGPGGAVKYTDQLRALDAARWRIAIALTIAMMVLYFGFILLVAYNKPLLTGLVAPGLSVGILFGALVIVAAWVLIWVYVRWANRRYDTMIAALRRSR
jgi:uncharacterized membrane protein (DUF485 family)